MSQMINNTLLAVTDVAEEIRGLDAGIDTPVAGIAEFLFNHEVIEAAEEGHTAVLSKMVDALTTSESSTLLDYWGDKAASIVVGLMGDVDTAVRQISAITTRLGEVVEADNVLNDHPLAIETKPTSVVMQLSFVRDIAKKYAALDVKPVISLPVLQPGSTAEDAIDIVKLGGEAGDAIRAILNEPVFGDEILRYLTARVELPTLAKHMVPEVALGIHVICMLRYDVPPLHINDMRLNDYNSNINDILEVTGYILSVHVSRHENQVNTGRIYIDSEEATDAYNEGTILLNEEVYNTAIESGVTPEAIIGNTLSGRMHNNVKGILDDMTRLHAIYDEHHSRISRDNRLDHAAQYDKALSKTLTEFVNLNPGLFKDPADAHACIPIIIEYCSDYKNHIYATVREFVAHTIYPGSSVHDILITLDTVVERGLTTDTEIDYKSALELVIIDYVYRWIAKQIVYVG